MSYCTGPPKVQPGHTYTLCIRGVNDCGPGEWSLSTVVYFQDDAEKEHSDEETCTSTQDFPDNDIASPRQEQVAADVTASVGNMSVSSKYPHENLVDTVTTPSPQAQTYTTATDSLPLASSVPVELTLPSPLQPKMLCLYHLHRLKHNQL